MFCAVKVIDREGLGTVHFFNTHSTLTRDKVVIEAILFTAG